MTETVAVIIPARNEPYLGQTVRQLLATASDPIEVFIVLDGAPLHEDDKVQIPEMACVTVISLPKPRGIRKVVNTIVPLTNSKFIVKLDAHCRLKKGWDVQLKQDWEPHTIQVPSRYSLDAKTWKNKDKPAIEYLYLTYPYEKDDMGYGFHGRKLTGGTMGPEGYYQPENDRKNIDIDEIMIFQGSMWFMAKEDFIKIDGFDERFDNMWQEPLELSMKVWLSGGRVLRNKRTWYAHRHKNTDEGGRCFRLSKSEQTRVNKEVADYWMNNQWEGQIYSIAWYVDKFQLNWPKDWDKDLIPLTLNPTMDKQSHHEPIKSKNDGTMPWVVTHQHVKAGEDPGIIISNEETNTERTVKMLSQKEVHGALKALFRVKRGDIPPYTGWKKPSTREDLFECMNGMGCFLKGAEVGVAEGSNAKFMLDTIAGLQLMAVDPWHPYARWSQERMDKRYAKCCRKLRGYGPRVDIIRKTSLDHAKDVADGSLDFVYLDGFHEFDWIMQDIINWAPKVRKGGIVAGHDYYPFYRAGVIDAVDVYVKTHNIREWYLTRERHSSFFWVA